MGVQPPSNDIDEEPDVVEFGIAALDARVEELDVTFPVQREELLSRYGDMTIPINASGTEVTLGEVMQRTELRRFESEQELLNALHPVFEEKRSKAKRNILAQLRALVPF